MGNIMGPSYYQW